MATTDGLEHLEGLRPVLREALAEAFERPPLTFKFYGQEAEAGLLQMMFEASDGRTYVCTVRADGSPPVLCNAG